MATKGSDFEAARVHPRSSSQHLSNFSFEPCTLMQRDAVNAKERSRNTNVNIAFSALRTLIPTEPRDRKLSKIETLRLASSYIGHLANLIKARTEGDYEGQVCQRYGCIFKQEDAEAHAPKHICTFCLTDSKRNHQFVWPKTGRHEVAVASEVQINDSMPCKPSKISQNCLMNRYSHFSFEETEIQQEQSRHCVIKEEIQN